MGFTFLNPRERELLKKKKVNLERFVLTDSLDQLLKDFAHFYGNYASPVEALQAIEKIDSSRAEKAKVRIVKVTFEELP